VTFAAEVSLNMSQFPALNSQNLLLLSSAGATIEQVLGMQIA
jgi:hypothetical protein